MERKNGQLYEVMPAESENKHKKPVISGFFIQQYTKLRKFQLYYIFFTSFCNTDKYEEKKMVTDSLYLALAEKDLYDCLRKEKKQEWEMLCSQHCIESVNADAWRNFYPERVVLKTKNMMKGSLGCSRKNFDSLKRCVCVASHTAATILWATSVNSAAGD